LMTGPRSAPRPSATRHLARRRAGLRLRGPARCSARSHTFAPSRYSPGSTTRGDDGSAPDRPGFAASN
jgi:hypothetical protein